MNRFSPFRVGSWLAAVAPIFAIHALAASPPVTTASLLGEMTNLAGMAEFPDPGYTCRQFSSYDRASKSPSQDWFANGDCGQYLRTEETAGRHEFVMMDADGPGAVVRIWSANPAGTLRIYLDGAGTPALEAPMDKLLGGTVPGYPKPIAGEYSRGWNLYFPIPYARHCKITSDQGKFYYHVNYRTYPEGTNVETFDAAKAAALPRPDLAKPPPSGGESRKVATTLVPGQPFSMRLDGGMAIRGITLTPKADDLTSALRAVLLKIRFDGTETVVAPLGDFFGSAPGINPFTTLPLAMESGGRMRCSWFMPFRREAEITLLNTGDKPLELSGVIETAPYQWSAASMYFHAKWRAGWDVPTRPMIDWNYLTATGKGVFAGVSFSIDNPVKEWWGEGDEKIYVDGEKFPSHFGTGTEDYYGYAWCWPGLFTHPYHSQSRCDGPGNYGRTSVNRFHIIDRIPFTRDFRFDMELWHWHERCKVNMAVTAYWYAAPGATDGFKQPSREDLTVRPMPEWQVPRVPGAIEGEKLRIIRVNGTAGPQDWDGTSGGSHLWWHAGMKPGDTITLALPAPKAGKFRVRARFLSAPDYGIHRFSVNGKRAGEPIDFYHDKVRVGDETDLGEFDLREGDNEFSATVEGANSKALKAYMLGLDYLKLEAVP